MALLELKNVRRIYKTKNVTTTALKEINFTAEVSLPHLISQQLVQLFLMAKISVISKIMKSLSLEEMNLALYFRISICSISSLTETISTCPLFFLTKMNQS